jgi:hypothetical protein
MDAVRAAAPCGVARVGQLERLGVPGCTVRARWQAGGPWQRLLPGVVLMQSGAPSEHQRLLAALVYAGGDAILTGAAACRCYGLRRLPPDNKVHVLVAAERQPASAGFVVVERTTRLPQARSVEGLPMAPAVRAVLDAARRLRRLDQVRALVAEAVQRQLCQVTELTAELAAGCQAGTAAVRQVLQEVDAGVRSVAECHARALVAESPLSGMLHWNVAVFDERGNFLAIPDAWADVVALAWEIDSYEFHLSPQDYGRTLRRRAAMTSAGIIVAHVLPSHVRTQPQSALAELEDAYRLASQRPRPPVRMAYPAVGADAYPAVGADAYPAVGADAYPVVGADVEYR